MVTAKPWRLDSTLRLVLGLFVSFFCGLFIVTVARLIWKEEFVEKYMINIIIASVAFQGMGLVLIARFLRQHQVGWQEAFGFGNELGWAIVLGLCVGVIVMPTMHWLQWVWVETLTRMHISVEEQEAVKLLRENHSPFQLIYMILVAVVFAPLTEEMFFRGILYPFIKQRGYPQAALWGTALLFALAHGNVAVFLPLLFLAVTLALLYEWTNNLLACILVHAVFNAANFLLLFLPVLTEKLPAHP
ncbi:MAG TPA: CPBP family intramembrane glutamic endopeptidase [Dongiaceae bacterium]|jgi:membrane protease YdiL (CAAX protease family)|nr:CPBP family intramembrane glutamic endopeptidase [Dongiaceae bacterium]